MDTQHFKEKLEAELALVTQELNDLGVKDKSGEWAATDGDLETMAPTADSNEYADQLEEYQERREEVDALQARHTEVKVALEKIDNGTYGVCEVSGEPIEEDRLEANPAAKTCKAHM